MHPDRARNIEEARRRQRHDDAVPPPKIGSIHRARVSSIREFGAFVDLESSRVKGLVHISELSSARVDKVSDIVDVGEMVWVKLIDIKDDRRLSFSMKYCDQGSGRDLDVNEVKLTMARSGQKVSKIESGPISFGAVLDTTCTRCGVHGHTSKECYADISGNRYDLIPDISEELDLSTAKPSRKHKRDKDDLEKHEKKHKHGKERKYEKSSHKHDNEHKHERSSHKRDSQHKRESSHKHENEHKYEKSSHKHDNEHKHERSSHKHDKEHQYEKNAHKHDNEHKHEKNSHKHQRTSDEFHPQSHYDRDHRRDDKSGKFDSFGREPRQEYDSERRHHDRHGYNDRSANYSERDYERGRRHAKNDGEIHGTDDMRIGHSHGRQNAEEHVRRHSATYRDQNR